jgi:hypothetical protein
MIPTMPSNQSPAILDADVVYLCRLPRMFRGGTHSAHTLVHRGRISPRSLTRDAVRAVLEADPKLIDEWQGWSQDKRTSSGWFLEFENGAHVVGRLPDGYRITFPDATSACTEFILRELRDIG